MPPTATPAPPGYTFTITFDVKIRETAENIVTPVAFNQAFATATQNDADAIEFTLTGTVCTSDPFGSAWNMTETYHLTDSVNPSETSPPQTATFQQSFARGAATPFAGKTLSGITIDMSLMPTNPITLQVHAHADTSVSKVPDQTFSAALMPDFNC
jgi:hypothetical protein